jgi:hypothetical protein
MARRRLGRAHPLNIERLEVDIYPAAHKVRWISRGISICRAHQVWCLALHWADHPAGTSGGS